MPAPCAWRRCGVSWPGCGDHVSLADIWAGGRRWAWLRLGFTCPALARMAAAREGPMSRRLLPDTAALAGLASGEAGPVLRRRPGPGQQPGCGASAGSCRTSAHRRRRRRAVANGDPSRVHSDPYRPMVSSARALSYASPTQADRACQAFQHQGLGRSAARCTATRRRCDGRLLTGGQARACAAACAIARYTEGGFLKQRALTPADGVRNASITSAT